MENISLSVTESAMYWGGFCQSVSRALPSSFGCSRVHAYSDDDKRPGGSVNDGCETPRLECPTGCSLAGSDAAILRRKYTATLQPHLYMWLLVPFLEAFRVR